ncbi:MAG TPA: protein-disulfide reductase DsbD domain-containing protein [Cyclobacteriaceae bacterium]
MIYPASWLLMISLALVGGGSTLEDGHIKWRFSSIEQSGSEWKLLFTASVDRGWHLYSHSMDDSGPMPTSIVFDKTSEYKLVGKISEHGDVRKSYDSTFMMDVSWYEGQVVFTQRVKVRSKAKVTGSIMYSVCSEETCIPGEIRFSIDVGR